MYFSATLTPVLLGLVNEWAVQILVLFSFALQLFLLLFAWLRRHNVSPVPRLLLWMAYQLADSTALFTLGHLSISSRLEQHQLVAFWAPLLLVHLGGQDTITAYSIEDNGIWLRHLQTLVVQVAGAAYIIYKYIPGSETLVIAAAVLIFVVGVLKYWERIWALKCASLDSIWLSLDSDTSTGDRDNNKQQQNELFGRLLERRHGIDEEDVLMAAHGLLDVCKGLFIGLRGLQRPYLDQVVHSFNLGGHLDKLMEMELSLMYDIMYTKAAVIHTWQGLCIRVTAPVATVAAFVLFQISSKEGHNRHDVAISYVLLVGALVLEVVSLVRALGSTWTRAWLYHKTSQESIWWPWWSWLHNQHIALRRAVGAARNRRWSGSVGQYNLLLSCAHDQGEPAGKLSPLGLIKNCWSPGNDYLRSAEVSESTKELVLSEVLRIVAAGGGGGNDHGGIIGSFPGLITLNELQLEELIGWSVQDIVFEDSIIAWHIAGEICMFQDRSRKWRLLEAITVMSNYMMFLLVKRPYMLPGPVRRSRHEHVRADLCQMMQSVSSSEPVARVEWALRTGLRALVNNLHGPANYDNGVRLADILYHKHHRLQVIFGVLVEMLCYVAHHCSRESHARQLSGGGELLTIVWLMASHATRPSRPGFTQANDSGQPRTNYAC